MQRRGGFTLVEVVIAASVLVIALFGILGMAFHTYKKSDVADEAITASNLASERLAYFRSHANPFKSVGGTFYAPPKARNELDLNQDRGTNRSNLHNIWNQQPVLFVREYLYGSSESRYKNFNTLTNRVEDQGRQAAKRRHGLKDDDTLADPGEVLNFVAPTPMDAAIDGIFPNWGNTAAAPGPAVANQSMRLDGTNPVNFTFRPAPRANDTIRGANGAFTALPNGIRYVREVWVQTNHPLGAPFTGNPDESVATVGISLPGYYGTAQGTNVITNQILRGAQAGVGAGVSSIKIPNWVVTVTVRVFVRDPLVKNLTNDNTTARTKSPGGLSGIGYDPSRPLATAVGYFGVRHQLGN